MKSMTVLRNPLLYCALASLSLAGCDSTLNQPYLEQVKSAVSTGAAQEKLAAEFQELMSDAPQSIQNTPFQIYYPKTFAMMSGQVEQPSWLPAPLFNVEFESRLGESASGPLIASLLAHGGAGEKAAFDKLKSDIQAAAKAKFPSTTNWVEVEPVSAKGSTGKWNKFTFDAPDSMFSLLQTDAAHQKHTVNLHTEVWMWDAGTSYLLLVWRVDARGLGTFPLDRAATLTAASVIKSGG